MTVDPLTSLADEIDAWAAVSTRPGQLAGLERIAAEVRTQRDRYRSWAGLMALLDEHYPADVFGGDSGNPGPRIVALIRECDVLRYSARELKRMHDECHQQRDEARSALKDLVDLKDGPRDERYRAMKDAAWDQARFVVSGRPKPAPDR